jgi:hypothetical protein
MSLRKMAKQITFSEAATRFGPLITTNIQIEDAIREAFCRIYEMGRWPGTTKEIRLNDSDFIEEDGDHYLLLDEETYDGMIGFRNSERGWTIMDHSILYRDKINGGDLSLIDMGTIEVESGDEIVSRRKYRMPLGFVSGGGPFWALMKMEAPELHEDTVLPIHSVGALKCAILAVSYEMTSDDERANLNWQKFNELMTLSSKQVEGTKRYYVGFNSSLRRRPTQFM